MIPSEQQGLEERIGRHLEGGDRARASEEAVRGYGPEILAYLVVLLRDHDAAREVFAQSCERFWKGLPGFRGDSSVRTWFYKLAWNTAQNFRRDAFRRRVRRLQTTEISKIAQEVQSTVSQRAARQNLRSKLRETLEPHEQTLLTLRVDRGLSWKEVALVLSEPDKPCDEAAARKRYERLKTKLRKLLEEEGPGR